MAYQFNFVTEFAVKEKIFSLSGDSFDIVNVTTNETMFKVDGKLLSIRDSKKLLDAENHGIFKMTEKPLSIRDRMHIKDLRTGNKLTMRKKSYIHMPVVGGRTVYVWDGEKDDGDPMLEIHGDLLRKDFVITDKLHNRDAAAVKRHFLNPTSLITGRDKYSVRVNPGYDTSLMIFLAISVDEYFHD